MIALCFASSALVPNTRPAVSSRRAALVDVSRFALGAAAISALPLAAQADAIEDIAARANAKAAKERDEAMYGPPPEPELEAGDKLKPILLIGGGGIALSIPFYFQNLQRLAGKVASGGADSGYAKKDDGKKNRQSKKLTDAKGAGAGKAAKSFFFKQ